MFLSAEEVIESVFDRKANAKWHITRLQHWASTDSDAQLAMRPGIKSPDECGSSAVHWAAHENDNDLLATLLRRQAVVDICDHYGENPVHITARSGSAEQLLLLREAGASVSTTVSNNVTCWAGGNALHLAANWGNLETLEFLLDSNCDPTIRLRDGSTPLHCAIHHLDKEARGYETTVKRLELCVKILLKKCPDSAQVYDLYGHTPLQRAFLSAAPPKVRRTLQKRCAPAGDKRGLHTYWAVVEFDNYLKGIGNDYYKEVRCNLIDDLRAEGLAVVEVADDMLVVLNYLQWWRWMIQSSSKSSV